MTDADIDIEEFHKMGYAMQEMVREWIGEDNYLGKRIINDLDKIQYEFEECVESKVGKE